MSAADSACYVAKQSGRGQVHVYSARDEAVARERGNVFEELMQTVKSNSLGQISNALYHVGGEYRRNM